jgi:hypothetical protein
MHDFESYIPIKVRVSVWIWGINLFQLKEQERYSEDGCNENSL